MIEILTSIVVVLFLAIWILSYYFKQSMELNKILLEFIETEGEQEK